MLKCHVYIYIIQVPWDLNDIMEKSIFHETVHIHNTTAAVNV